jgi:hypothetical protein
VPTNHGSCHLPRTAAGKKEESNEVWLTKCKQLLELTPGVPLGLYECPVRNQFCTMDSAAKP